MSDPKSKGWHKATFLRRCCKCKEIIPPRGRYYGDYREPLRLLCVACKGGHVKPVVYSDNEGTLDGK